MSEKLIMPKNVQSFVDKYGGIGSKEQDSAFWKEFRKAANAYANVQAQRICDLEHALAEEKKYSNKIEDKIRVDFRGHPDSELWGEAGLIAATMRCVDAVDTLTEQRDRLAAYRDEFEEVAEIAIDILAGNHPVIDWRDAGQSELLRKLCQHLEENASISALDEARGQRDRLAEALESIIGEAAFEGIPESKQQFIYEALQSLNPTEP